MYFNLMFYKKWWYKALTVLVIIALVITFTFVPLQRAKAVGVLTVSLAAIILAAMAGAGIYTVVSGMTFSDIQSWMTDKLDAWDVHRNDGQYWYNLLVENNNVGLTVKGFLKIEYDLATYVYDFIDWLINGDLNLSDNQSTVVTQTAGVFNLTDYFDITGQGIYGVSHNTIYFGGSRSGQSGVLLTFKTNTESIEYDANFYASKPNSVYDWTNCVFSNQTTYKDTTINITNLINCGTPYNPYVVPQGNNNPINGSYHYYANKTYGALSPQQSFLYNPTNDNYTAQITLTNLVLGGIAIPETGGTSLTVGTDVVGLPDVDTNGEGVVINPGLDTPVNTTDDVINGIVDGVTTNTLDVTTTLTSEYVDAQEVVITNPNPIQVDTDHHLFGFTLPSFNFNFASIWHYVTDAIDYVSSWIAWFVALITAVPVLHIPLYMSFTLIVIICFIKRVIL